MGNDRSSAPPRAVGVNVDKGCPNCGSAIYASSKGARIFAWIYSVEGHPWKVQCPHCGELFPTNDFGAFYASAIDPQSGLFEPTRGNRSLLYHAKHPDPSDPKHLEGVDDGSGSPRFGDGPNDRDWYIAYHVLYDRAERVNRAVQELADAYALTGDPIYAHKCAILLDRLADVYPDYNGIDGQFFNNLWKRYSDGILGPAYSSALTWPQHVLAYDTIYDGIGQDPETLQLLHTQASHYKTPLPKNSVPDIRRNIEQRILLAMVLTPSGSGAMELSRRWLRREWTLF